MAKKVAPPKTLPNPKPPADPGGPRWKFPPGPGKKLRNEPVAPRKKK